jgi:Domain of unknown function (DUF4402)
MANRSLIVAGALLTLTGAAALPSQSAAQCLLCAPSQQASGKTLAPIRVEIETTLDFAKIALLRAGQGGTATIDPVTGQRTLSGSLANLSGIPVTGTVLVRAEPKSHIDVTFPTSVQMMNGSGRVYSLSNFTTTLKNNPKVGDDGTLRFTFGGLLRIDGTATGRFQGSIPIIVDYK